jgi:hypothetical protein
VWALPTSPDFNLAPPSDFGQKELPIGFRLRLLGAANCVLCCISLTTLRTSIGSHSTNAPQLCHQVNLLSMTFDTASSSECVEMKNVEIPQSMLKRRSRRLAARDLA